ncbi:hypothetical protein FA048_04020 [Pedobacter polaris]|uniref:Uncharacterized protein n=1 Tax=Pedobacter polaris TaxID=2571273 RepID=A0A4U1CVD5_9SPHI|nr:hypothetical protein [Pedobacter polaris]TKC12793.1 hypothetical protein FA048_04020 [Pedobacter polaris]
MIQKLLNLLISAQLIGFGLWCIYYCIRIGNSFVNRFDIVVTFITRIVGILFILQIVFTLLNGFFSASEYEQFALANRGFGPYWLEFWLMFLIPLLCTQLLWIRKLRSMRYARLAMGLFLIGIQSIEKLIILIASSQRDFIPGSVQNAFVYEMASNNIYLLLIFFVFNFIAYLIVRQYHKLSSQNV